MDRVHELIKHCRGEEDKETFGQIRELLKTEEGLFCVSLRITGNFYMGTENGRAAAFVFTSRDYADDFVKELKWIGLEAKTLEIHPSQRIAFFSDLYRSGFEAVVIDKTKDESMAMSLFSVIEKPADPDMVVNPDLMRAAAWFYQGLGMHRAVEAMQDRMCAELYKGRYLAPIADPRRTTKPLLTDGRGGKFFPVFTDWVEFGKFDRKRRFQGTPLRFRDLKKYLADADGIVLNPFGFGLRLDTEKLERIEKENMKLKIVK